MRSNKFLTLFLSTALLFTFSACSRDTADGTETETETESAVTADVLPEQLSDGEKTVIESITKKDISKITEDDFLSVETVSIVGKFAASSPYMLSFSKDGYAYKNSLVPYGDDLGDSLSVLKLFKNLNVLGIYFCESLTDVSFLESLTNLRELTVVMTGVKDFTVLDKLGELESLRIKCSPAESIAFSDSGALRHISISNSNISDLTPFESLKNLETFSMIYNNVGIKNTGVLSGFEKLSRLELIAPEFDLDFFDGMNAPSLNYLILGGFDGIDLSKISGVSKNLLSFDLKNSNSTDLTPLDSLPQSCMIQVVMSENCTHGKRTTEGADMYSYSDMSHDMFDWYYEK